VKLNYGGIFDFDIKSEKLEQVNAELEDPMSGTILSARRIWAKKKILEAVVNTLTEAESACAMRTICLLWRKKKTTTIRWNPSKPTRSICAA
jgi:hypothetical protein